MSAKSIFTSDIVSPLMDGFLSDTFTELYTSAHIGLDGAKDFASAIKEMKVDLDYDHTDVAEDNLKEFLEHADTVINTTGTRTVYMDSNIALTDGSKLAREGARVIPNLYEAIDGLRLGEEILAKQTKDLISTVADIDRTHGPSTADAGLFVSFLTEATDIAKYTPFLADSNNATNYVVSPGVLKDGSYDRDANADKANGTGANLHFEANEITFTVANQNATISNAYSIDAPSDTNFELKASQLTTKGQELMGVNGTTFYWVPLEGHDVEGTTIKANAHGKIFAKGSSSNNAVVLYSHAVAKNAINLGANATAETLTVSSTMTYNLGAIIEAIQELNRRTMFMDIDMTFNGALSYGDYTATNADSSKYGKLLDGLPAGSDGNLANHIPVVQGG